MNEDSLKPCPFCGNKNPEINISRIDKEVICNLGKGGCGARIGWYVSIQELRRAWNQRVKRVAITERGA